MLPKVEQIKVNLKCGHVANVYGVDENGFYIGEIPHGVFAKWHKDGTYIGAVDGDSPYNIILLKFGEQAKPVEQNTTPVFVWHNWNGYEWKNLSWKSHKQNPDKMHHADVYFVNGMNEVEQFRFDTTRHEHLDMLADGLIFASEYDANIWKAVRMEVFNNHPDIFWELLKLGVNVPTLHLKDGSIAYLYGFSQSPDSKNCYIRGVTPNGYTYEWDKTGQCSQGNGEMKNIVSVSPMKEVKCEQSMYYINHYNQVCMISEKPLTYPNMVVYSSFHSALYVAEVLRKVLEDSFCD